MQKNLRPTIEDIIPRRTTSLRKIRCLALPFGGLSSGETGFIARERSECRSRATSYRPRM
jgi:hypothetical protein